MGSQPRYGHEDTGDPGLGFLFHEIQEGDNAKAVGTLVIEGGGDDEKKIRSKPEQGAGAEKESHFCAGAADPTIKENQKRGGGDQEPSQQQPEASSPGLLRGGATTPILAASLQPQCVQQVAPEGARQHFPTL
ncbi:homeobox protein ESX1-like [Symphalangus syndactylus]|uniref:homeobox protein ESX1-like n=1 Tax=Symphalangus syndactylus TaxID=9590 RepID=UPI0030044C96